MKNLLNIIGTKQFETFSGDEIKFIAAIVLKKVVVKPKEKAIILDLFSPHSIEDALFDKIERCFSSDAFKDIIVKINLAKPIHSDEIEPAIEEIWDDLLDNLYSIVPAARLWMTGSHFNVRSNRLYIYIRENGVEFHHKNRCLEVLQRFLRDNGINCEIVFQSKTPEDSYDIGEEDRALVKNLLTQAATESPGACQSGDSCVLLGKAIKTAISPIGDIKEETSEISIEGEIFDLEIRELRNKVLMVSFCMTDLSGSIRAKIFLSGEKKGLAERLRPGLWVNAKGRIEHNKYSHEYELIPTDIALRNKPQREDLNPEKRAELHLHTRYSSQDALCSPKDVIELAKKWGHPAVAFTDHGVVQSFPEVYNASKGSGVKPIYGIEAYVFDDVTPIMSPHLNRDILTSTFIVADIETTGLSFDSDEIIEIGAVKIVGGTITDSFGAFIKPTKPISANIVKLTGITGEMVKDALDLKQVMPSFLEFLGDGVFVAHNASFDAGFIGRDCMRLGITFNNPVLDTLAMSRILLTDLNNHKLNTIAKKMGINMGRHHRAEDDAKTTAQIFLQLLNLSGGITNLKDINNIKAPTKGIVPLSTYHVTVLVKNQRGLRRLYELVSTSHLDYFYRHPRIPISLLNNDRDDFIIGSGCQAGELYQNLLQFSPWEKINRLVEFYDFLEIQPIQNNAFLIENGRVSGKKRLEDINKKIYKLGKEFDKPVVLTGDVHFMNPSDEIYRKVLLAAQGFQGADRDCGLFFRTTDEMLEECRYLGEEASREVVIENSNVIAAKVDNDIKPVPDKLFTPKIDGAEDDIVKMTYEKAGSLYGENLPEIVQQRIEKELSSIVNNGYAVIYLIAHKLVDKSMKDGYLVGSRGSVGSSLVATMCGITEVNPLPPHYRCAKCKHTIFIEEEGGLVGPDLPEKSCPHCNYPMTKDGFNIPFEVFMGFHGDKVPDIDLNFSGEYQSRAHKYTEELFGKDYVFRAGTISTIADKTAYGYAKGFAEERGIDANSAEIKRLSSGIIGVKRTTGQHPGGVMVVPKDMRVYDFTPIQHPADDRKSGIITTHFDYHSISDQLLKLDLLGHDDPTVIKMLEEITKIDALGIPLDDPKTMSLFSSIDALNIKSDSFGATVGTFGVPEFGTRFVRQMLEDTRPTTFSELVRISGLSHGTDVWLNNAQDLIKSKAATLREVIATRDDIMIYLINRGIDPGISFNIMERVRKGRQLEEKQEKHLFDAGIDPWFIESCKKIKYLFPKAHAVAYVIMAFRIAYFKVHYPEAFYATFFTARADDFDAQLILQGPKAVKDAITDIEKREREASVKERSLLTLLEVANEMYLRDIGFTPINLYKSDMKRFKVTSEGILPPLSALQGLGITAAQNIVRERKVTPFSSREDLKYRTRISKNVLQILLENGVLSDLPDTDQISLF